MFIEFKSKDNALLNTDHIKVVVPLPGGEYRVYFGSSSQELTITLSGYGFGMLKLAIGHQLFLAPVSAPSTKKGGD